MRLIALVPALLALSAEAAPPAPQVKMTPVAVELFTSQGCSSCPPADALIEKLAKEPNIIAITRPVTYWDNLGWKDTLGREANTILQRSYAARGGEGSGVYTPQAMVQGEAAAVGSSEAKLRRLIAAEKQKPGPAISARMTADGGRAIMIDQPVKANASVLVVALKGEAVVRIGAGENGGRVVRYTNVVLAETDIGRWLGGSATITVPGRIMKQPGADRYAVLLREGSAGRIVAARYI
jgi:hypothetical protein